MMLWLKTIHILKFLLQYLEPDQNKIEQLYFQKTVFRKAICLFSCSLYFFRLFSNNCPRIHYFEDTICWKCWKQNPNLIFFIIRLKMTHVFFTKKCISAYFVFPFSFFFQRNCSHPFSPKKKSALKSYLQIFPLLQLFVLRQTFL